MPVLTVAKRSRASSNASRFSDISGAAISASSHSNTEVVAHYTALFKLNAKSAPGGPPKTDAQVMATAPSVYVTNRTLAGTAAATYSFQVTEYGLGARGITVSGALFGNSGTLSMTVLDLLLAVNTRSKNGLLLDNDGNGQIDALERSFRTIANEVFETINEAGDI